MDEREVLAALHEYVAVEILEGDAAGLDAETPLLEWGVLNSMELGRMAALLRVKFGVALEPGDLKADHFRTLGHVAKFVILRQGEQRDGTGN